MRKRHVRWYRRGDYLTCGSPALDRRSTAAHEAAHAVVAHLLREKVFSLWLDPRDPRHGNTVTEYTKRRGRLDPFTRAMVSMAGHEAEHRLHGRPLRYLPADDYRTARRLGLSENSVRLVGWYARQHVRWFEREIRRVAAALLKAGKLDRRQFLVALKAA